MPEVRRSDEGLAEVRRGCRLRDKGASSAKDLVETLLVPRFRAAAGDDLLHQDVDGLPQESRGWSSSPARIFLKQGGLFKKIVAGGGEEAALGDGATPVPGAADALHGNADVAGGRYLADEVDVADVDAELERGGSDEDLDLAGFEASAQHRAAASRESEP